MSHVRSRTTWILATIALLAAAAVVVLSLLAPVRAFAQAIADPPADMIVDQQNVVTDPFGRAALDYRDGELYQACLTGHGLLWVTPVRTVTAGVNHPNTVAVAHQEACGAALTIRDREGNAVPNATVRVTYGAMRSGGHDTVLIPPTPAP